ncbi:TonB-dependent siderophore receptor [Pseudomonas sp. 148P]|uniref:TonB-dependent siderophore receptor n=1 Tax=Pseudomonas ulcerans TaxID=3115852 RepID=A0ABU7I069_9PSED|nr:MULTISPECIES: TonB-dependent siderophore receptor [unclassified Pseudomonas]MEE1925804.1 TonB-dependent siderophore receptor [Pseudomonas sp. 147P]MEE1937136.1 TonB-dependent siderophore receptor [Pseudomonas sp. 148P]
MHHLPASQRSPLNLSITRALFAGLLAATPLLPGAIATAQAAPAEQSRAYAIPAGNLDQALNRFASEAGILLSVDSRLTAGKRSPGLSGSFTVDEGLVRLLAGTGLAPINAGGNYALEPVSSQGDALELGATSVNAQGLGATTEGTGSYTTGSTSTATKMNLSIRETPQTITVVTRQRMDDQHLGSMTEVLNQTPGITMSQDGGERFNIYSRGSGINTYQFDGVTTYQDNQTRNMPNTLLDMALYDRIEIVRGATGLMTGAGDPSAVINVMRKRPTREFKSHVQAGVGSWDYYRAEADVSGPLTEDGKVRGRFVAAEQDNHTFMDWYSQDRSVLYGVLEADVTDSTLVRFGIDRQTYKVNGAPGVPLLYTNGEKTHLSRSNSSDARWGYDDYETTNYTLNLEQQLANDWQLKVAANYMDVDRNTFSSYVSTRTNRSYLDPDGSTSISAGVASADQYQKGIDANLQGPFELLGQTHELIVGFNYLEYQNQHREYAGPDQDINYFTWRNQTPKPGDAELSPSIKYDVFNRQSGYFAAGRFNLSDSLHLILGARVSNYRFDYSLGIIDSPVAPDTYSMHERGVVTPYAGVVYDLTGEQSVYASYTEIFKPQSNVDISGRPLDPEVGKNYEMGWKGEFLDGRLNASVAVYLVQRDNFAEATEYQAPNGATASKAVDGAETKGVDLELSGEVLPGWNVYTGYSHTRTEDADGVRLTSQLPMDTFRFWNTWRLPGALDKLTLGGGVNWNSASSLYFSRYDSRVTQDDYFVASLMARYKVNEHLAATLNVNNLFDEKYYAGMAGSYGHYGAPRNATVSLRYDF